MNNDLISREALKKALEPIAKQMNDSLYGDGIYRALKEIDNAPTVKACFTTKDLEDAYIRGKESGKKERAKGEWIPIKYRPMTSEERKAFADYCGIEYCYTFGTETFDCPMPEDGQEILISTSWGVVEDVADNDIDGDGFICYGLETNGDWDGVNAWMPKPEPYKKGGAE